MHTKWEVLKASFSGCFFRFVEYLEQRLPTDGGRGMLLVFERLIQRFLNVEQYANDIRYVNYCIKCVSLIKTLYFYSCLHSLYLFKLDKVLLELFSCLTVSYRQVITWTLFPCTVRSSVGASAPGQLACMWPGLSTLNREDCMNRLMQYTRKRWRTKLIQPALFSMNTSKHLKSEMKFLMVTSDG